MTINNLSQLKKAINSGSRFEIVEHYIKPEHTGEIRKPTKAQTNGFYSVIDGDPEHPVSMANYGKGYWIEYGKASGWKFENGVCCLYDERFNRPVWAIRFID